MQKQIKSLQQIETALKKLQTDTAATLKKWNKHNKKNGYPHTDAEAELIAVVHAATSRAMNNDRVLQTAIQHVRLQIEAELQSVPISAVECTPSEN